MSKLLNSILVLSLLLVVLTISVSAGNDFTVADGNFNITCDKGNYNIIGGYSYALCNVTKINSSNSPEIVKIDFVLQNNTYVGAADVYQYNGGSWNLLNQSTNQSIDIRNARGHGLRINSSISYGTTNSYKVKILNTRTTTSDNFWVVLNSSNTGILELDPEISGCVTHGYCYQETANVSTACGAKSTGVYYSNLVSGNTGEIIINYSKPSNAISSSLWQVKHGINLPAYNISIPSDCWDYSNTTLSLKITSDWDNSPQSSYPSCYNGTWKRIGNNYNSTSPGPVYGSASFNLLIDGNWTTTASFSGGGWAVKTGGIYDEVNTSISEEAMYWDIDYNNTLVCADTTFTGNWIDTNMSIIIRNAVINGNGVSYPDEGYIRLNSSLGSIQLISSSLTATGTSGAPGQGGAGGRIFLYSYLDLNSTSSSMSMTGGNANCDGGSGGGGGGGSAYFFVNASRNIFFNSTSISGSGGAGAWCNDGAVSGSWGQALFYSDTFTFTKSSYLYISGGGFGKWTQTGHQNGGNGEITITSSNKNIITNLTSMTANPGSGGGFGGGSSGYAYMWINQKNELTLSNFSLTAANGRTINFTDSSVSSYKLSYNEGMIFPSGLYTVYCANPNRLHIANTSYLNMTIDSTCGSYYPSSGIVNLSFVNPTPANNSEVNSSFEINMTIPGEIQEFKWNWNGVNYSFYDTSLKVMYNFDNISSLGENNSIIYDLSYSENLSANNGAISGATYVPGRYGNSLNFSNVNSVTSSNNLNISIPFTFEVWVNPTIWSSSRGLIMVSDGSSNIAGLNNVVGIPNRLAIGIQSGGSNYRTWDAISPSLGVWTHIVGIVNGTGTNDGYLYYNGVAQSVSYTSVGSVTSINAPIKLGNDGYYSYNGLMDNAKIYNRSLSTEEVKQHYYSSIDKYGPTDWRFYSNQSGFSQGTGTYSSIVNNVWGESTSEVRTYNLPIPPTPSITITLPLNNSVNSWTVLLRATITSGLGINATRYEVRNGTISAPIISSGTMNNIGGDIYNATFITNDTWPYNASLPITVNLTLVVYANDSTGVISNSSTYWTLENSIPGIQYITPPDNGLIVGSNFNLNVYLTNFQLDYSQYNITNSSGAVVQTNQTNLSTPTLYWTDLVNISQSFYTTGNYTLTTYALDTVNNSRTKTNWFYVDKTPPTVTLISPPNNTLSYIASQLFNCSTSDNYGIANNTLYLWNSTNNLISTTSLDPWCYQESANVSTSCGGLSSGRYAYNDTTHANLGYLWDGNWSTYINYPGTNFESFNYINYTKPTGALSSSLFKTKSAKYDFTVFIEQNNTIPLSCWNAYSDTLVFRLHEQNNVPPSNYAIIWECYDGISWQTVYNAYSQYQYNIYEEAMWWSFTPNSRTISLQYPDTYKWNCLASDIYGNSGFSSANFSLTILNSPPLVTLVSPQNNTGGHITPTFTCNATDAFALSSMSLYVWNSTSLIPTNSYCYQESSNVSNQTGLDGSCSLNYGGSYNVTSSTPFYVTYKKPYASLNTSLWVYKTTFGTNNISIPSTCWQQTDIQFQVTASTTEINASCYNGSSWQLLNTSYTGSGGFTGAVTSVATLYDGNWNTGCGYGQWTCRDVSVTPGFLEEAMLWDIASTKQTTGISNSSSWQITLPRDGNYLWNCLASDNYGNSSFASSNYSYQTNRAPTTPSITTDNTSYNKNQLVKINCTGSTDPDLNPINYTIQSFYDSSNHTIYNNAIGYYEWNVSSINSQNVTIYCRAYDGSLYSPTNYTAIFLTGDILQNSIINQSTIIDSSIINSNITLSSLDNTSITLSTVVNSIINDSTTYNSTITNSMIINSTITNSNIANMTVINANITDNFIYSGSIIYNGYTFQAPLPLSVIYTYQPALMITSRITPTNVSKSENLIALCNATQTYFNITYSYSWFKNGVQNTTGTSATFIPGFEQNINNFTSSKAAGDQFILACRAYDGVAYSSWMNSSIVTISSYPPSSLIISPISPVSLISGNSKNVIVSFNVSNRDENLNVSSSNLSISKSGTILSSNNCSLDSTGFQWSKINCSIAIPYYSLPGTWTATASIRDNALNSISNISSFIINSLDSISVNVSSIDFGTASPGQTGVSGSILSISNLGNTNYSLVEMTAFDLNASSNLLAANNFCINDIQSATVGCDFMQNATIKSISGASIPINSNSNLYPFVNLPVGLTYNIYGASHQWILAVS